MSKPSPIEKWIEEQLPYPKEWPTSLARRAVIEALIDERRAVARETAHYILEELGVLECLEKLAMYKGINGDAWPAEVAEVLLTKLKGEKDE